MEQIRLVSQSFRHHEIEVEDPRVIISIPVFLPLQTSGGGGGETGTLVYQNEIDESRNLPVFVCFIFTGAGREYFRVAEARCFCVEMQGQEERKTKGPRWPTPTYSLKGTFNILDPRTCQIAQHDSRA